MKVSSDLSPAPDMHTFALEDEALLLQSGSGRIFRLNPTASVIWQGLSGGIDIPDIVTVLARSTGGKPGQIAADIEHLINQWKAFGFFKGENSIAEQMGAPISAPDEDFELLDGETITPCPPDGPKLVVNIIDTDFMIEVSSSDVLTVVEPLISHLKITNDVKSFIRLSVVRTDRRYVLLIDGVPEDWCLDKNGIAPMVHANAMMTAYDRADCLIGVHSAAMEINGKCIMLPALSGSGKSTLTAALVAAGFGYLADDLVLLTDAPVHMRPVPVAIGLKKGAWPVLASRLPALSALSTHLRADDKLVRYFVPDMENRNIYSVRSRPVHAIVFPKYEEDASIVLNPISRSEALCRIAAAGYDAHSGLTLNVVTKLIDWIAATATFELKYNCLNQAIKAIGSKF